MGPREGQVVKWLYSTRTRAGWLAAVWDQERSRLVSCCMGQGQEQVGKLLFGKGTAAGW